MKINSVSPTLPRRFPDTPFGTIKNIRYNILAENVRIKDGDAYQEGFNYFKNRYGAQDFSFLEPYANKTAENSLESLELRLPKIQDVRLASMPGHQLVSNNVLFIAITALALAQHSKKSCVNFEWVYNGRSSIKHMSTVGLLFNVLPLSVPLSDNPSFSELLEDIGEQVRLGIQYSCVHYVSTKFQSQKDYAVAVIYQDKMHDFATLCGEEVTELPMHNAYAAATSALNIEITQEESETQLWFHYNSKQFDKSFMEALINIWGEIAKKLLACADAKEIHVNDLI